MNTYAFYIAITPLLLFLWIYSDPLCALKAVADLQRKFRHYLIKRYGEKEFNLQIRLLKEQAHKDGLDINQFNRAVRRQRDELIYELGVRIVNSRFGEPSPLHKFFYPYDEPVLPTTPISLRLEIRR